METDKKIILHLCASKHGSDSRDYREIGYDVRLITKEIGVENYHPPKNVYGIIANPPCTMFSIARSRAKTPRDLEEGMRLVKECLRIIWECQYPSEGNRTKSNLAFWVIENPATGALKNFLGKPTYIYSPHEFGEDYTKKTALWGLFNEPPKPFFFGNLPRGNNMKNKITPMTHNRNWEEITDLRSIASPLFTKAFYEANK